jgi:hypothetical protein
MVNIYSFGISALFFILIPVFRGATGSTSVEMILDNTITISMLAPEIVRSTEAVDEPFPIPNDEYRPIALTGRDIAADGLGTIVNQGGVILIATHDHWSLLDRKSGLVRLSNSAGVQFLEIELDEFRNHILYRDGGTMVLDASSWINGDNRGAAELFDPYEHSDDGIDLGVAASVQVAFRDQQGNVTIAEATVTGADQKVSKDVIRLKFDGGQYLDWGDSGGGIWFQGKLLANTWTAIIGVDSESGAQYATDMSVAAVFPQEFFG